MKKEIDKNCIISDIHSGNKSIDVIEIQSNVQEFEVNSPIYAKLVSVAPNVQIRIKNSISGNDGEAIDINQASEVVVYNAIFGRVRVSDRDADIRLRASVHAESNKNTAIQIDQANVLVVGDNIFGDVIINSDTSVNIHGDIHGNLVVNNPHAEVSINNIHGNLDATNKENINYNRICENLD